MIKQYCDMCGKEVPKGGDAVYHRVARKLERVHVEIVVGVCEPGTSVPTWNGGNVCHQCVLKVVTEGSDVRSEKIKGDR